MVIFFKQMNLQPDAVAGYRTGIAASLSIVYGKNPEHTVLINSFTRKDLIPSGIILLGRHTADGTIRVFLDKFL